MHEEGFICKIESDVRSLFDGDDSGLLDWAMMFYKAVDIVLK